jgi:hypothetical protein
VVRDLPPVAFDPFPAPGPLARASGGTSPIAHPRGDGGTDLLRAGARVLALSDDGDAIAPLFDTDPSTLGRFGHALVFDLVLPPGAESRALLLRGVEDDSLGAVEVLDGERLLVRVDPSTRDGKTLRAPFAVRGGLVTVRITPPEHGEIAVGEIELDGRGAEPSAPLRIDALTPPLTPPPPPERLSPDRAPLPTAGPRSADHLDLALLARFGRDARVVGRLELRGRHGVRMTYAVMIAERPGAERPPPARPGASALVEHVPSLAGAELARVLDSVVAAPPPMLSAPDAAPTLDVPAPGEHTHAAPGQTWRDSPCDSAHPWVRASEPRDTWLVRVSWSDDDRITSLSGLRLATDLAALTGHELAVIDQDGDGTPELRLHLDGARAGDASPCGAQASAWWVIDAAEMRLEGHFDLEPGTTLDWDDDLDGDGRHDVTLHAAPSDPSDAPSTRAFRYDLPTDTYVPYVPTVVDPATLEAP